MTEEQRAAQKKLPLMEQARRMVKARPAALMDESLAEHIRLGNFEDDFERLKEADWILEAIIERV